MAAIIRDSIKLSLEVQTGMDKDGTPKYSKKSINFKLRDDVTIDEVTNQAGNVMTLVGEVLASNYRYFYITESSAMQEA